MSPLGFLGPNAQSCHVSLESGSQGGSPFPVGFDFPRQGWTPRKRSPHCRAASVTPGPLSSPAGYLLSLFVVSLFLLMIGSSAFSSWWLGVWLDKGSQVSSPLALANVESVAKSLNTMSLPQPPPQGRGQRLTTTQLDSRNPL